MAGGLAAFVLVGGGGFLLGRSTSERAPAVVVAGPTEPAPVVAPVVDDTVEKRDSVLTRRDLIALAAAASDAVAAQSAVPAEVAAAEGRRFEINIPFGCNGPSEAGTDAQMRWRYDSAAQVLRISVSPVRWSVRDWSDQESDAQTDAIEGFWVARPWTASDACPPQRQAAAAIGVDPVTLPGQTLAMAQFFTSDGPRQGRRGEKPYEIVKRMAAADVRGARGFRLQIRGRIARVPGGAPISCRQPAGVEQRPVCVIAMQTDEVAIQNPTTDETLATWTTERGGAGER